MTQYLTSPSLSYAENSAVHLSYLWFKYLSVRYKLYLNNTKSVFGFVEGWLIMFDPVRCL